MDEENVLSRGICFLSVCLQCACFSSVHEVTVNSHNQVLRLERRRFALTVMDCLRKVQNAMGGITARESAVVQNVTTDPSTDS